MLIRRCELLKYLLLFFLGGFTYGAVEICSRGYSHISMFLAGGICFVGIGLINEIFPDSMPLVGQMLLSAVLVTVVEYIVGVVVNLWMGLGVWDYSNQPLNFQGQICLTFFILWFFLSLPAILLDDYLRYHLFKEPKHTYRIF